VTLERLCSICGTRLEITIDAAGAYVGGQYFGKISFPVPDTGAYVKVGEFRLGRRTYDVVDWTGTKREFEYWECDACYERRETEDVVGPTDRSPE